MKGNLFLNKKTLQICEDSNMLNDVDYVLIISNEEIRISLPEIIQHDVVVEGVLRTILLALKRLSLIDLPIQGVGRINLGLESYPELDTLKFLDDIKNFLLKNLSDCPDISTGLYNVLRQENTTCIFEIVVTPEDDFRKIRGMGPGKYSELKQFLQRNGVNDQITKLLQDKRNQLEKSLIANFASLEENQDMIELRNLLSPFIDFSTIQIKSLMYGNILHEILPYRHATAKDYKKTPAEKKLSAEEKGRIEELMVNVRNIASSALWVEFRKFVEEL